MSAKRLTKLAFKLIQANLIDPEKGYEIKVESESAKNYAWYFITDDGRWFSLEFDRHPRHKERWHFGFADAEGKVESTGKGDAFKIFSTVAKAVESFIKKHQPLEFEFSADSEKESRQRIYTKIADKVLKPFGYKFKGGREGITDRWFVYEKTGRDQMLSKKLFKLASKLIRADGNSNFVNRALHQHYFRDILNKIYTQLDQNLTLGEIKDFNIFNLTLEKIKDFKDAGILKIDPLEVIKKGLKHYSLVDKPDWQLSSENKEAITYALQNKEDLKENLKEHAMPQFGKFYINKGIEKESVENFFNGVAEKYVDLIEEEHEDNFPTFN